jgi:hypothetical protein
VRPTKKGEGVARKGSPFVLYIEAAIRCDIGLLYPDPAKTFHASPEWVRYFDIIVHPFPDSVLRTFHLI